jgi:hypothetical protein
MRDSPGSRHRLTRTGDAAYPAILSDNTQANYRQKWQRIFALLEKIVS